jgi:hypothetical protein
MKSPMPDGGRKQKLTISELTRREKGGCLEGFCKESLNFNKTMKRHLDRSKGS